MSKEAHRSFECFGGTTTVHVRGECRLDAELAVDRSRVDLLDAHDRLSRFRDDSELSLLNRDPRTTVPASRLLRQLAAAVKEAAVLSGGLVDATLLGEIERAGYRESIDPAAGRAALDERDRPARLGPARARPMQRWREIQVNDAAGTISRPPGLRIDSGGHCQGAPCRPRCVGARQPKGVRRRLLRRHPNRRYGRAQTEGARRRSIWRRPD